MEGRRCFACGAEATHEAVYSHFTAYFCEEEDHQLLFHYDMVESLGIKFNPIKKILSSQKKLNLRPLTIVYNSTPNLEEWLTNYPRTTTNTTPISLQSFSQGKKKLSFSEDVMQFPSPVITTGRTQRYRRTDIEITTEPGPGLEDLLGPPPIEGFQLSIGMKDKVYLMTVSSWNSLLLNIEDPGQNERLLLRTYPDKSKENDDFLMLVFERNQRCAKLEGRYNCLYFLKSIQIYTPQ
jgi:hypothetical protein